MAKCKRKPVFADDDSEGDTDDGQGFKTYIQKKSAKLQKQMSSSINKEPIFELKESALDDSSMHKSRSSYIDNLLKSKKQRALDKLHAESVKNQLQDQLDWQKNGASDSFITPGYQEKKEEYKLATKVAEEELAEHISDSQKVDILGNTPQGVALSLLLSGENFNTGDTAVKGSTAEVQEVTREKSVKYENDIYRADNYHKRSSGRLEIIRAETALDWNPNLKEMLVRKFLQSTITSEELREHAERYKQRHKNV